MVGRARGVITVETPDDHDHWRSFVALLLLTTAVSFGMEVFYIATRKMVYDRPYDWIWAYSTIKWTILAAALVCVAYSLWRKSATLRIWLVITPILWIGLLSYNARPLGTTTLKWFGWESLTVDPTLTYLNLLVLYNHDRGLIPWSIFFVAAWYIVRSGVPSVRRPPVWAQLAAAWSFIYVLNATYASHFWYIRSTWLGAEWFAIPHLLLPLLLGILLLRSSRFVVPLSLLLFLVALARTGIEVHADVGSLYRRGADSRFWLNSFHMIGNKIIRYGVPWIIIAVWAWRGRMTSFPEDGSPYPRRYCAQCHYNLHGLQSERCPECGERI